ncbi:MAG: hypothetical protein DRP62_04350 [Planctomycetota bacterium]|nr:MAG: hypothetical protein DRP62_04350 [Planctomycetota bacterium]
MSADMHYRGKCVGYVLGGFYNSWLSENGLDFVACGKRSTSTIKNNAALRLLDNSFLLLLDGNRVIILVSEKL